MKILHIEDNKDLRQICNEIVTEKGHQYYGMDNAKDALKVLTKYSFELILLDLKMPKYTGFDFLKEIQRDKTSNQEIVIITGMNITESHKNSLHAIGVKHIIKKPLSVKTLIDIIDNRLAKKRMQRLEIRSKIKKQNSVNETKEEDKEIESVTETLWDDNEIIRSLFKTEIRY